MGAWLALCAGNLAFGTRILWVGAVVCLPRIPRVGAEGFAGRGSLRLTLDVVLLAKNNLIQM